MGGEKAEVRGQKSEVSRELRAAAFCSGTPPRSDRGGRWAAGPAPDGARSRAAIRRRMHRRAEAESTISSSFLRRPRARPGAWTSARKVPRASLPVGIPWERGLPSPQAEGQVHGPRPAPRICCGLEVRAPEQCPATAQGATGIPARDFPPVGRDRRARRDFNPKSAIENGVEPPRHQGTKKCGFSRRGAEAQRGAAARPPDQGRISWLAGEMQAEVALSAWQILA